MKIFRLKQVVNVLVTFFIIIQGESAVQTVATDAEEYQCQHETQVSEGGEADLHKHFVDCQKNPGHKKFIPVKTFSIEHLPEGYRDQDLFEWIKAAADLTVRVDVKMTSPHRPEFYPDTNDPYPFYNMRNKPTLRLGTGEIHVYKFIDGRGFDVSGSELDIGGNEHRSFFDKSTTTCPCTKCQHSDKPSNVWWEIFMHTATHVVFDEIEASHTSCSLFFDGQDSQLETFENFGVDAIKIDEDKGVLKYATCVKLGEKLHHMEILREDLWRKALNKYKNVPDGMLTFIVSHPHGCPKQVSVGHLMDNSKISEHKFDLNLTKLTYTTCTCPGSSGAAVYCVGSSNSHVHSGAYKHGHNYSSYGYVWK